MAIEVALFLVGVALFLRQLFSVTGIMAGKPAPDAELPPEMWAEILARAPVKDLLRSRCVSKTWCSVIDNSKFIRHHLDLRINNNSDDNFLLTWKARPSITDESEVKIMLRMMMDNFNDHEEIMSTHFRGLNLLNTIDYDCGLMLIRKSNRDESFDWILLNPSIRRFMVLPPLPSFYFPSPNTSGYSKCFLVYDPITKDHKVVMVQHGEEKSRISVGIYALSTGRWEAKNTQTSLKFQASQHSGEALCINGVVHWLCFDNPDFPRPKNTHIVSFDLKSDQFSFTRLPGDANRSLTFPFLLGDSYALFAVSSTRCCIWVLNECGARSTDAWSTWYDRPCDPYTFVFFRGLAFCQIFYAEKIKKLFVVGNSLELKSYELETHAMKDLEGPGIGWVTVVMGPYVESLVLSKGAEWKLLDLSPEE